jgi:predicted nucleic acid-binding protein
MYLPRWSNEILDELRRTLLEKLGRSPEQVDHLLAELNRHFADARVEAFETLVAMMMNDPGDRHVIAAAVKCRAEAIVTFNLRHFPDTARSRRELRERFGPSARNEDETRTSAWYHRR